MDTLLYIIYAFCYIALFVWGLRINKENGWLSPENALFLVTAGLIYDNAILASGSWIGKGETLENMNLVRYWLHGLFTPTLVLFAWTAMKRAGVRWIKQKPSFLIAVAITVILIVLELAAETVGIRLKPDTEYGVLSYEPAEQNSGPPMMVMAVSLILLFSSLAVWKKQGWKWMAIGVILMGLGSAIPIPVDSNAAVNGFELILLTSLWATKRHQEARMEAES
ncbi:hypothetical protein A8F94_12630 [Bacillus sp. FJAT-27225]|uniref:hypothetical protein n=1 Tax=Bacillus sp. FJAT-27225 TaxID=1743144 RepID=UPI00080C2A77|nr:hypothetical protein [Bacillus sp. FJAT-27225]OCA85714.1 hypothetical protein A8F94_12630 [Bacillus sp. FJAT-27225]